MPYQIPPFPKALMHPCVPEVSVQKAFLSLGLEKGKGVDYSEDGEEGSSFFWVESFLSFLVFASAFVSFSGFFF